MKPEVINKLDFVKTNKVFKNKIKSKSTDEISIKYSYFNLTERLTFVSEVFNKFNINLCGTGKNLNTHIPLLVNYFFNIYISPKLKIFNLNCKLKSKKIPL